MMVAFLKAAEADRAAVRTPVPPAPIGGNLMEGRKGGIGRSNCIVFIITICVVYVEYESARQLMKCSGVKSTKLYSCTKLE